MNTTKNLVQPYLFFNGACEEAIQFYRAAVGAEIDMLMRFKESPDPCAPASAEKIMHASLRIGETLLLLSDGRCSGARVFEGFALSLTASTPAEADRFFAALADGGNVMMHLAETFYSPRFGMVTDRFGVLWMVIVPAA